MVKKTLNVILIVCIIFSINSCSNNAKKVNNENELEGTISISGAFALYPMTVKWANEFQKLHPNVRIDVSAGGAGKGIADALAKMVDFGMVSRGITSEEIAKGAWFIALTKDAVFPTINLDNPVKNDLLKNGVTKAQFIKVFLTEEIKTWGELAKNASTEKINVFTRSDACGAAEMWGKYLGKNQESLKGTGVFGDPGIADAVRKDKNSIGFNNLNFVFDFKTRKKYDNIEIIPIDLNENGKIDADENFYNTIDEITAAIQAGKYPSPPARDLYFVAKGKPESKIAIAFLTWILTDGQKFVKEAGYVDLPKEKIEGELAKLK